MHTSFCVRRTPHEFSALSFIYITAAWSEAPAFSLMEAVRPFRTRNPDACYTLFVIHLLLFFYKISHGQEEFLLFSPPDFLQKCKPTSPDVETPGMIENEATAMRVTIPHGRYFAVLFHRSENRGF